MQAWLFSAILTTFAVLNQQTKKKGDFFVSDTTKDFGVEVGGGYGEN